MPNHVHLLVEAGQVPLAKFMQGVQQTYTLYFNRKQNLVGHLFQAHHKAILCDRDSYLFELVRYLHLNPVRAKLVDDPAQYRWSSHRTYLGNGSLKESWIDTEWILSQFSGNRTEAVRSYKEFVLDGIGHGHREDLYAVTEQRYLGNEQFVERVTRTIEDDRPTRNGIQIEEIEEAVCRNYNLPLELLQSSSKERRGSFGRAIVAYVGQELGHLRLNQIAQRYGRDQVSLSLGVKRLRERIKDEGELKQSLNNLLEYLSKRDKKLNN
jgi:putative transposase